MRDPRQVAAEFVADKQPYAVFIDNNLGSRKDYLHALCRALRPLNKIWSAAVSIDVTDDPELIRNMALADAQEFSSVSNRSRMRTWPKRAKDAENLRLRTPCGHVARFRNTGKWVVRTRFRPRPEGYVCADRRMGGENRLECATFHILTPYPAPPAFRQMESENRLLHRDWTLYDTAHAVFRPST